jgi:hypothetical protein
VWLPNFGHLTQNPQNSGISHKIRKNRASHTKSANPKPQSLCDPINTAALDPSFGFDTASAQVWERFTLAMHVAAASGLETGVGSWYTGSYENASS